MIFQMSLPIELTSKIYNPDENPMSPLKIWLHHPPFKTQAHEMHEKAGSTSNTCVRAPLRGDMNKRLSTKPGWGRTVPVCYVGLSGCTSS